MLTRDSILAAKDFTTRTVNVPEWDGDVLLRGLSSKDRDNFEAELAATNDMRNLRARLVVKSIVDADGNRLFSDEDADVLGEKNSQVMIKLFDVVRDMSGMSDEELEAAQGN
jgi:hypothetical protein